MWTPETRALVGDYGSGQALSDEQYRLLEPLIPAAKPGGHPRTTDMRRLLDGLFYLVRTGCQWRHLPPPSGIPAVADYLAWIIHEARRERWARCGGSRAGCVVVRHRRRSCRSAKRCRLRGLGLRFVELGRGIRPRGSAV
jgi:transposase